MVELQNLYGAARISPNMAAFEPQTIQVQERTSNLSVFGLLLLKLTSCSWSCLEARVTVWLGSERCEPCFLCLCL